MKLSPPVLLGLLTVLLLVCETAVELGLAAIWGAAQPSWLQQIAHNVLTAGLLAAVAMVMMRRILHRAVNAERAIESTNDGYWVIDAEGRFVEVNDGYCRMMGYSREEIMSRQIADFEAVAQQPQIKAQIARILAKGYERFETRHRHRDGHWIDLEITVTGIDRRQLVAFLRDISARKLAQDRIKELAYFDSLTGLPNRRLLQDRIEQALIGSQRTRDCGAIVFVDLDNFKLINDTRGHAEGDQVLMSMAERLRGCVRLGDSVARLGGDEFVVLLEALSSHPWTAAKQAEAVAEKCREALLEPYSVGGMEFNTSASLGLVLFSGADLPFSELMKRADTAMYEAKAAGRNRVVCFEPDMQQKLTLRSQLEADLRRALAAQQLVLYLQPQFDAAHRLVGAEALLRWQHPTLGLLTPQHFISMAEETGLILSIGAWVLASACQRLERWQLDDATSGLHLAVNVSVLQFSQPDFVPQLRSLLGQASFPPGLLQLELTESLVISQVDEVVERMHAIRALGVQLSMDDFGTGHSSLSNLRRLPLQQLKIDQAFVRSLPGEAPDVAVVRAIITLGGALGLAVIAEGVESEPQRALLEANGCHLYQGYHFSPPVPLEEFESRTRSGWLRGAQSQTARTPTTPAADAGPVYRAG
jgi:diguanylate cyclase (GGDEF)-like protein/PAS domain S-box-containing protein